MAVSPIDLDHHDPVRAYVQGLPGRVLATDEQRAEYRRLVDAYLAAVALRDGRGREAPALFAGTTGVCALPMTTNPLQPPAARDARLSDAVPARP